MAAADFWTVETPAPAPRLHWAPLALGLVAGLLLGIAVTALAGNPIAPTTPAAEAAREWRHPALDREWRGTRTPVDVNRMFRTRR